MEGGHVWKVCMCEGVHVRCACEVCMCEGVHV